MAVTPYPQNLFHAGAAKPLKLHTALTVPGAGDFGIQVTGNASLQGWPPIPVGQKMVITVGRGTEYEQKFLISSVSSGASESTLLVKAEDRNYDGTLPVNCPAGTAVEHTVSATEMATINDHMRTRQAHGADGALVDEGSAQTLANKTLTGPTVNGGTLTGATVNGGTLTGTAVNNPVLSNPTFSPQVRFVPVGAILMWPKNTLPDGFLACDGQPITAQSHPELFAVVGGTVPNLNGQFVKGGDAVTLTSQGSSTRTLSEANMPAHKHDAHVASVEMRPHSHGGFTGYDGTHQHSSDSAYGSGAMRDSPYYQDGQPGAKTVAVDPAGNHRHTIPSDTAYVGVVVEDSLKGSGTPFNIEPPHLVLRYIICAKSQGV